MGALQQDGTEIAKARTLSRLPLAGATLLVAFSLIACTTAGLRSHAWSPPPRLDAPAYYEVLERATWYDSIYVGLDLRAFVAITWDSPALREEQLRALEELRGFPLEWAAEGPEEEQLEFLLSLYTRKREWNDLAAEHSIWNLDLLIPGGEVVAPLSIERISRPDANLVALYPYISRFSVTYRIRFPARGESGVPYLGPEADFLGIRLSSAVGRCEARWLLVEQGRFGQAR